MLKEHPTHIELVTQSQNGLGWKGPQSPSSSNPMPWARTPPTSPGCSKPRPAWPGTLPGMGHLQLLWAACASTSPPSQGRVLPCIYTKSPLFQCKAIPPRPITKCPCRKPLSSFLAAPLGTGRCSKVSPQPSLLQAEPPQLSQPVPTAELLQPLTIPVVPSGPAPTAPHLSCAEDPQAGGSTAGGSHQSGAEGQSPLPRPAGHAAGDAAQGTGGSLGCERTVSGHVQLLIHQHPRSFWAGLLSIPSSPACTDTRGCPKPRAGPC